MRVQMQCGFVDVPTQLERYPTGARAQGARKLQLEEDCKNLVPNLSDSLLERLKAMSRRGLNESSD
jgi:hypothetical protein